MAMKSRDQGRQRRGKNTCLPINRGGRFLQITLHTAA
jgi:hypothetical protein